MAVAVKVQSCPTCSFKPKVDKFTEMAKELFGDKVEFTSEDGEKGMCVISIGDDVVYEKKGKGKGKGKDKDKDKDKDKEGKGEGKDKDKEKDKDKDKDKEKDKDKDKGKGKGGFGKPTPEELVEALKKIGEKCGVEVASEPDGFAELQKLHEEQIAAGPPEPPPEAEGEERPWYQFW
jgi:hypothetical protein